MGKKRPKNFKEKSSKKLKSGLYHIIRKLFEQQPDAVLNYKQVCTLLHVHESEARKLVVALLRELNRENFLVQKGHETYALNTNSETIEGELELTQRGSGFVITGKNEPDVFISQNNLGQAIHGDIVKVVLTKNRGGRPEGRVIEVVNRERTQCVGTIHMHDKFAFLIPDNSKTGVKIYIPLEKLNNARHNDKALVRITVWPKSAEFPFGKIIQTLGGASLHDAEMISILVNQGIPIELPREVKLTVVQPTTVSHF